MARAKKAVKAAEEEVKVESVFKVIGNSFDTVEYNGSTFKVVKRISANDMMTFVQKVSESCFSDEGEYTPEVKEFSTRLATIIAYTDIDTNMSINEQYDLCYSDGLINMIHDHIDKEQFVDIIKAINDKISYESSAKIQFIYKQVNEVAEAFASVLEKFEGMYDGVNPEDLKNLVGAIGNMNIDESKIVKAFMKEKKKKKE